MASNLFISVRDEQDFVSGWEAWVDKSEGWTYSFGFARPMFRKKQWSIIWEANVTESLSVREVWVRRPNGDQKSYSVTHSELARGDIFTFTLGLDIAW